LAESQLPGQAPAEGGLDDERAGHVDARRLQLAERDVADPGPRGDVAVDRAIALGMQREEPVCAADLEALPGALLIGLEQQRPGDARRVQRELPPAPAVAPIGRGPDHLAVAGVALTGRDPAGRAHDAGLPWAG